MNKKEFQFFNTFKMCVCTVRPCWPVVHALHDKNINIKHREGQTTGNIYKFEPHFYKNPQAQCQQFTFWILNQSQLSVSL